MKTKKSVKTRIFKSNYLCFYPNKIKNNNGNTTPATASFQPLFFQLNLPAFIIIVPVKAMMIKLIAKISE